MQPTCGAYAEQRKARRLLSALGCRACVILALRESRGALAVPKKLRNAPTGLMKAEGYGEGYRYAHDYAGSYVPGETYLPDEVVGTRFYEPSREGYEQTIAERLARWRGGDDR